MQSCHSWVCYVNTPALSKVLNRASTSAFHESISPSFPPIILLSYPYQMYIALLLVASLPQVVTLALSRVLNWKPNWVPSRLLHYLSSPKRPNLANTGPSIIFHTLITPHSTSPPSTLTSTVKISHAPGEPLTPLLSSSHVFLAALKLQSVTWPRPTRQYQPAPPNGPVWSSVFKQKTNSRSTPVTTSGYRQQGASTARWQTPALTYSVAMGSVRYQNGSMTTFSSAFPADSYHLTTPSRLNGAKKFIIMGDASKKGGDSGIEGMTSQMVPQANLMRTAASRSKTWQRTSPVARKMSSSRTRMRTSMPYPIAWASGGRCPKRFPLGQKSHSWVSYGTLTHVPSAYWKRRGSSIWLPSPNGKKSAHTTCLKLNDCMENSIMPPWLLDPDAHTLPTWRPCWPPFIIALSYRAPHPGTLRAIWNGGSNGSASQTSPDQFQSPPPSLTSKRTQTPAPGSESLSPSAKDGMHGDWPPDGSRRVETFNGPRPSASNYLSHLCSRYLRKETTSRSMATTGESSKAGGKGQV